MQSGTIASGQLYFACDDPGKTDAYVGTHLWSDTASALLKQLSTTDADVNSAIAVANGVMYVVAYTGDETGWSSSKATS